MLESRSMMTVNADDLTELLVEWGQGDKAALDRLTPLVYDEIRRIAHRYVQREREGQTLQTTALVNEAYLRLAGSTNVSWQNRAHFYAVTAQVMRRILIDHARRKATGKRGHGWERLNLDNIEIAADADDDTLLLVNESLEKLAHEEPKAAEIVKLRFFAGLTLEEAGQLLGFTERTAKRHWAFARAWLYDAIKTVRES